MITTGLIDSTRSTAAVIASGGTGIESREVAIGILRSGVQEAGSMGNEDLRSLYTDCLFMSYRLLRRYTGHPMWDSVHSFVVRIVEGFGVIIRRLDGIVSYLNSIYLGEIYSALSRLERQGAPKEDIERLESVYEKYRTNERDYARLTGVLLTLQQRLDAVASNPEEVVDDDLQMMERELGETPGSES